MKGLAPMTITAPILVGVLLLGGGFGSQSHGVVFSTPGSTDSQISIHEGNARDTLQQPTCVGCVIKNISVPTGPWGVAFDSDNGYVYVADTSARNVSVIDGHSNTLVKNIPLNGGIYPTDVAIDEVDNRVLVSAYIEGILCPLWGCGGSVVMINGATNTVLKYISVGSFAAGIAYDRGNGFIYATTATCNPFQFDGSCVYVISGSTGAIVKTIYTGWSNGMAYDPSNGSLYVADFTSNTTNVVSDKSESVVSTIPVGLTPDGIAYDSGNGDVYVTDYGGQLHRTANYSFYTPGPGNVSVIAGGSGTVIKTIPVGSGPEGVAVDGENGNVYVANSNSSSVSVINGSLNSVTGLILVGIEPMGVAYDSSNGDVYVSNFNSSSVSVISTVSLSSAFINPNGGVHTIGWSGGFTAGATCLGGTCPPATAYTWSLSNELATLNTTTGSSVKLTVGNASGTIMLYLNATLNGVTRGTTATISILPKLTSVLVNPSSTTVDTGGSASFGIGLRCTGGPCAGSPPVVHWSLTRNLGSLNESDGQAVFRAGSAAGTTYLFVNVTMNGITVKSGPVTIHVVSPAYLFGLPDDEGYFLVGGVAVAVAAALAVLFMRWREKRRSSSEKSEPKTREHSPTESKEPGEKTRS